MKKIVMLLAFFLFVCFSVNAYAEKETNGRYQIVSSNGTPQYVFLLDTQTGDTWHWVESGYDKDRGIYAVEKWIKVERVEKRAE